MRHCPICYSYDLENSSKGEYVRCKSCRMVRTSYNYDDSIYDRGYAYCYEDYSRNEISKPLNLFRLGLISRWLHGDARILDVGCGAGAFLRHAELFYECVGFEPNPAAAQIARKNVSKSDVFTHINSQLTDIYDCITMFDVIEHLEDPGSFLDYCKRILHPDGIVVVTTPNVDAVRNHSLMAWKHYKPKEHLFLYTDDALRILFSKHSFRVIHTGREECDIRPGNQDGDLLTFVARKYND